MPAVFSRLNISNAIPDWHIDLALRFHYLKSSKQKRRIGNKKKEKKNGTVDKQREQH